MFVGDSVHLQQFDVLKCEFPQLRPRLEFINNPFVDSPPLWMSRNPNFYMPSAYETRLADLPIPHNATHIMISSGNFWTISGDGSKCRFPNITMEQLNRGWLEMMASVEEALRKFVARGFTPIWRDVAPVGYCTSQSDGRVILAHDRYYEDYRTLNERNAIAQRSFQQSGGIVLPVF